ncbi:TetR/AcrR family transcriptional regulator [Paenibacillus radicis (ex Gao et al. 2016)]|uniref:TetR family transcriptional regulator n=1 Tax=Paenibacillus radicis (ex Gao et al. 2016) TaxID=1737354 RepID=A0A917LWC1_9BACL|nr:TetR/AcrR family transcriptional regulator [Paenibacillus radicis (ex Gao et al. 2016)]GGG61437.1 TetR family transcriptional regulator [Paenibacillus radicis (ex Gao et al. 2016)]
MNKKQLQSEQTKKRVADAARALFVKKGYKATSIEEIVEATGSSKGNIYYHFKSKEGLFLYLLDEWERDWEQSWLKRESQYQTTVEKLYGLGEQLVLEDLNHPLTKAADEFFNNEEKANDVEERIDELVSGHLKFNQKLLQQGIDSGEFRAIDVEKHAIVLESLILGLGQMLRKKTSDDAIGVYKTAIETLLIGIVKPTV